MRKLLIIPAVAVAAALQVASLAQTTPAQAAPTQFAAPALEPAGPKISFEVASVKPSAPVTPGARGGGRVNIPLTPGDRYAPNDGYLTAPGQTVLRLIAFVYSMDSNPDVELNALPDWAKTKRWDIEARAGHPATKDQMRAMVLSLLQDRFGMVTHYETRNVPVYSLVMSKPGHFGPQMRVHVDEGLPCDNQPGAGQLLPAPAPAPAPAAGDAARGAAAAAGGGRGGQRATPDGYPATCGDLTGLPGAPPGRSRLGGRNVLMQTFMATLRGGLDRTAVDQTGLTGRYDWWIEYVPSVETDGQFGANFPNPDPTGPKLYTAFKEQLGLELKATKADVPWLVFDHLEEPTAN